MNDRDNSDVAQRVNRRTVMGLSLGSPLAMIGAREAVAGPAEVPAIEMILPTRAAAESAAIPDGVRAIYVTAHADGSPVCPAVYREVAGAGAPKAWELQSNGGQRRWSLVAGERGVNVLCLGAVGDGSDATQALLAAAAYVKAGLAGAIYVPRGRYRIATEIRLEAASYMGSFGAGPDLIGDGPGLTIFENAVDGGPLFSVSAGRLLQFTFGSVFEGFSIDAKGARASTAIRLHSAYMPVVRQVHIHGMSANGIEILCAAGDADASNSISLEQVRIENCAGWGIKAVADPGFNENSFLHMKQVFIQGCGAPNANPTPPSGGMIWKGQILTLEQCAFTINENVALFIPGQPGLGQTAALRETTFENNRKRGLYVTGISIFRGENLQFYNNDANTAVVACEFDGSALPIRFVAIEGVTVRATRGNSPFTAFKIGGANAVLRTCRLRNVAWENFDYPGQARFEGWEFDPIPQQCALVVDSPSSVSLRAGTGLGAVMPLRMRGRGARSGEWVAYQTPNEGLTVGNAGLAARTAYYAYLYDNDGSVRIELSKIAPVIDRRSGYTVRADDDTRLFVGGVTTDNASGFSLTGNGWLNPTSVAGPRAQSHMWVDAAGRLRINSAAPKSDIDGTIV